MAPRRSPTECQPVAWSTVLPPTTPRPLRRVLVAMALAVLGVITLAPPAFAHATLAATSPTNGAVLEQSPRLVQLDFSEEVEFSLGSVRLFDAAGGQVDLGPVTRVAGDSTKLEANVRGTLARGTYVVAWRVASADSHPVHGAFSFSVGAALGGDTNGLIARLLSSGGSDSTVGAAVAVTRWVSFTGLAYLVGALVVVVLVWPVGASRRGVRRSLWLAFGVLVGVTVAAFCLQGAYASGGPLRDVIDPAIWREVAGSRFGQAMQLRLAVLVLASPLLWLLGRPRPPHAPSWPQDVLWRAGAVAAALGLLMSVAIAGHSGTNRWPVLGIGLDVVHLGAMSVWMGGLALLGVVGWRAYTDDEADVPDGLGAAIDRFSPVAFGAVVAVVLTGLVQSWRLVGSFDALTSTDYGRTLMVKVGLVTVVLAVGGLSRRALHRQGGAGAGLRRAMTVEVVVGLAVLATTAILVGQAPAQADATKPFSKAMISQGVIVNVTIDPARVGANDLHLYVQLPGGALQKATAASVKLTLPSKDLGPLPVPLTIAGPNHWDGSLSDTRGSGLCVE